AGLVGLVLLGLRLGRGGAAGDAWVRGARAAPAGARARGQEHGRDDQKAILHLGPLVTRETHISGKQFQIHELRRRFWISGSPCQGRGTAMGTRTATPPALAAIALVVSLTAGCQGGERPAAAGGSERGSGSGARSAGSGGGGVGSAGSAGA